MPNYVVEETRGLGLQRLPLTINFLYLPLPKSGWQKQIACEYGEAELLHLSLEQQQGVQTG